ncbi:hypothetical protein BK130_14155 [Viridibacillus sp. FSL H8-0123]|nr:hypothetical protein BK130_14155 [Viridibacillus sp. FSL H8-0123]
MKNFSKLFRSTNISSMAMFLGFLTLYTIISGIDPNIFIIAIITILFWIANSLQVTKENRK